jgi:hypothetical protein
MPDAVLPTPIAAPASAAPPISNATLTPSDLSSGVLPGGREAAPPKPGSARERMFKNLQKVADKPGPGKAQPQAAAPTAKPAEKPAAAAKPDPELAADPAATPPAAAAPAEDPKKGKVSPWKLVDEYKAKLAAAEQQVLEVNKRAIPEADWKKTQETLTEREKRLTELEQEIRYVNYSKSEEFKTKYQQPYEKQWQRTMSELGELTVETADGGTRPLAANDILDLVNAPLGKAHELAVERFGDLARSYGPSKGD